MHIKIGESYIDETEIAAICPKRDQTDSWGIWLKSGNTIYVRASQEEIVQAMEALGFYSADIPTEAGPVLTAAEAMELTSLFSRGYRWITADKDGHVHAFAVQPQLRGAYWCDTGIPGQQTPDPVRLREAHSYIEWNAEALNIAELLGAADE